MEKPSVARHEQRTDALNDYRLKPGEVDPALSEYVHRLAQITDAPLAAINFVDPQGSIWSASFCGPDLHNSCPPDDAAPLSFCHSILFSGESLSVADARADELFFNLPIVVNDPFVRSYLGLPLRNGEGVIIGTLCVLDTKVRNFSVEEIAQIEFFAQLVMNALDLRRQTALTHMAQKELVRQQQILIDTKRNQRDFLSNLSHEIRNPLHAILGLSDILKEQGLGPQQSQLLQNLTHSSQQMMETLNALLEHSKIESGLIQLNPSFFDLRSFMEETLAPLAALAEKKGVQFSSIVTLPAPCICHADKVRLRQVLVNLTSNALKFTETGYIRVELSGSEDHKGENLFSFRIIDSGIGIDEKDQPKLFEPYRQVSGDSSKGGTGLGLSICRKIVESMDGEIGLESSLGSGSTFWFALPLSTNRSAKVSTVHPLTHKKIIEGRVLLLEDNSLSSALAVNSLEKAGLEVLTATTLKECHDRLDTNDFDIILMDLHLGDVLPATLLHEVRLKSSAPIIAISGSPVDPKKGMEYGIDDSLQKPFAKDALIHKVEQWLLDRAEQSSLVREWSQSLARLEEQCGADFIQTTIEQFVSRHPAEIQKLHRYLEGEYWDKLELAAHSMKSTLATLGLMHLARLATEIEGIASSQDKSLIEGTLEQFRSDSRRTYQFLMNYVRIEFPSSSCEIAS